MKVFSTIGCRLLVDDIMSELTLEHRAAKAGLEIVVQNNNRPRATSGVIVGIGDDPFLYDEVIVKGVRRPRFQVGDIVYYAWSAGTGQIIEGHEFRSIEAQEITGIERVLPDSQEQDSPSPLSEPVAQSEQCPPQEPEPSQSDTSYQGSSPSSPAHTAHVKS